MDTSTRDEPEVCATRQAIHVSAIQSVLSHAVATGLRLHDPSYKAIFDPKRVSESDPVEAEFREIPLRGIMLKDRLSDILPVKRPSDNEILFDNALPDSAMQATDVEEHH